ncbi:MAG TPA: serine/threonine-protein kinase [Pyrinomonadaceae bacterium]|jgi:non-specific serine/threonine protein kinase/serine/threonine-protein kinase
MRTDEWRKVEELLNAALEVEPGERRRFLDETCAGAPELRREVESLLACEAGADGFLEAPALALSADFFGDGPGDRAGQTVGRYRVIREIGRGGMGAVFLAERSDGEFRQEVALKVVRRSFADTELARRFRQERQILASLNHPNIARLLDGGVSSDGEPFLAMEYVEGLRIDGYCEERRLSTRARLRLFLEVCRGVSYAHQHLVVHRDIKPSNVLVTKEGVPKLLDFGIAKLLDPEQAGEQTRTELRAFTPDYASPEQVSGGQITTASDVYSLGVLLSDLLRGARLSPEGRRGPGGWRSETPGRKTAAVNRSPAAGGESGKVQTSLRTSAGVELENIVAMARREDPARRYASAAQLAEDIQRYLDGLPVRAQKDSFIYRAGKFARRNKVGVAAAAVVVLTLVGGIIATAWQARRAEANQARAEKRFADVRGLSNALLNDIAPKIERLEGSTEARQALITQSLKYLNSLADESADDLTLQAELAAAYEKVGVLQGDSRKPSLSDFRGAIASLEKAQRIRRRLLEVRPGDAENRRLLAENLRLLAIRRKSQSDVEGGFRDGKEALQIYENLVAENPDALELRRAFLETKVEEAASYINLSRFAEAVAPLQQTAVKIEALRGAYAGDVETERIHARCLASLGLALSWEGRQPEAEAEMARAVAIAESLAARSPNDTSLKQDLWKVYESASSIYEEIDDALAFELCEKSRRVVEEVIAADRANAQARHDLSKTFSRLGILASNLGKPAEALGLLERAMAIVLELREKDPLARGYDRDLGALYIRIGVARAKQRDFPDAIAAFQKSAAIYEKQFADDAANTIALRDVAIAYRHAGAAHEELAKTADRQTRRIHLAAAKEHYRQALDAMLKAQAQKALPEVNRKLLEEVRKDVEELEKLR